MSCVDTVFHPMFMGGIIELSNSFLWVLFMFALEALTPKPNVIPNWLIRTLVLIPLLLVTFFGGIWLAAEPICWRCFHEGTVLEGWNSAVSKYQCTSCEHQWKPLINLHRYRRAGCLDYYY